MGWWFFIRTKDAVAECCKPKLRKPSKQELSNDFVYNKYLSEVRKETDRLLDKIAKYGIKSLTKREKYFLDNVKG